MSNNYKIREVQIELRPGVILSAEVSSIDDVKQVLSELLKQKLVTPKRDDRKKDEEDAGGADENPSSRIEMRSTISKGSLTSSNVLAFKDDIPQLLRPNSFSTVSDATLVLLYAIEIGLEKSSIEYDNFKVLFDAQNIKSGSPLPMLLTNMRNRGYVDKKAYSTDRKLRLTAKGEKKAIRVLKDMCAPTS